MRKPCAQILKIFVLLNLLCNACASDKINTLGPHQTAQRYHELLKEGNIPEALQLMNPEQKIRSGSPQEFKDDYIRMVMRGPGNVESAQKSAQAVKPIITLVRNNSAAYVYSINNDTAILYLWNDPGFGWGLLQEIGYVPGPDLASEKFLPNIADMEELQEDLKKLINQ